MIQDKENKELVHTASLKTTRSNRNISIPPILVTILKEIKTARSEAIRKVNDFVIFKDLSHPHTTVLLLNSKNIKLYQRR